VLKCRWVEGIDYGETLAPVARYETIRVLISIAASGNLHLLEFDMSTGFLNAKLEEEVHMEEPEGSRLNEFK
jgi:hypothetical protein